MFKSSRSLTGLLVLLAGCTATPRRPAQSLRPPDWDVTPTNKPSPERSLPAATPQVSVPTQQPPKLALPTAPRPAPVPPAAAPELTWISLARWGAQHGTAEPRRLSLSPATTYALGTSNGMLVVQVGSLVAYWDRLEFRLGFAPQLIGGQVFVHALDLKKNIEPLLRGLSHPLRANPLIVIDPGHGGSNKGAQSIADGRWEKEFTLDWARRLVPLLEAGGWRVVLTRTNDVDVSLSDRVAFAETHHADLFLSLHFNSPGGDGREQAGLETYCLTPVGMASSLTRGYADDLRQAFPNNAFDEQNVQFAARLHRALLAVNGDADRGVRRARFLAVLRGQQRPAVLIEGGYLSNSREARRIGEAEYRQRLAEGLARALVGSPAKAAVGAQIAEVNERKPETNSPKAEVGILKPETNVQSGELRRDKVETNAPAAERRPPAAELRLMTAEPPRRLASPKQNGP